jgi:hypothetical protein
MNVFVNVGIRIIDISILTTEWNRSDVSIAGVANLSRNQKRNKQTNQRSEKYMQSNTWYFKNQSIGGCIEQSKRINKLLVISIIAGLALFSAGTVFGATSWKDQVSIDSANQIDAVAKAKADALTGNIQAGIEASIKAKVAPVVESKKAETLSELQSYFDSKTTNLESSPDYQAVVADLDRIKTNTIAKYKAQIDAAFVGK